MSSDAPGPTGDPTPSTGAGLPITRKPAAASTLYDRVGGEPTFRLLVAAFYRGVAGDDYLRPMYPEGDLAPAEDRLRLFLMQYWGGPTTYSEQRGHPRLRMRHAPFAVTERARDHWLRHMRDALDTLSLEPADEAELWEYLVRAAQFMINTPTEPAQEGSGQ